MDTAHPAPHGHDRTRLTDDERAELTWLRSENTLLRVERDILLRIATDYTHDVDTMLHQRLANFRHHR